MLDKNELKLLNKKTKESPYFKYFIKEKYKSSKGYPEYKTVMFELARMLTLYQDSELITLFNDFTHKCSFVILEQAYRLGYKSLWLDKNLGSSAL